ncbi:hypothetical protein HED60_18205 [Planctomycetales bacterium ZRK34]|nr:hypothetical protein HED60_18205 [Planctomycetales bacterium ZRK34]
MPRPFDADTLTAIGVAVADSPEGPWRKVDQNPVLKAEADHPEAFDSMRVDDAVLIVRDNKVWLYYKGRCVQHRSGGAGRTQMGVAIADCNVRDLYAVCLKHQLQRVARGHGERLACVSVIHIFFNSVYVLRVRVYLGW